VLDDLAVACLGTDQRWIQRVQLAKDTATLSQHSASVPEIHQVLAMVAFDECYRHGARFGIDQLRNRKDTSQACESKEFGLGTLSRIGSVVRLANNVPVTFCLVRVAVVHRDSISAPLPAHRHHVGDRCQGVKMLRCHRLR
jgi:hypothetical protein